ncbi:type VII secretion protein EssA [Ureibacillus sp. NPDC094379]
MKCKFFVGVFVLWMIGGVGFDYGSGFHFHLGSELTASAASNLDDLSPNEYKEKEFKDNKEYLHNESLLESRKGIPEEQKQLDFIPNDYDPNEKIKSELFVNDFEERKTIAYESMKLGLFSGELEVVKVQANQPSSVNDRGNKNLQFVYIGLLIACILIALIWLIPKMVQVEK